MGIDNSSILVFGWIIDFQAIKRIFNSTGRKFCQEDCRCPQCWEMYFEFLEEWGVGLGDDTFGIEYASPYYDCEMDKNIYVFGQIYDSIDFETMAQIMAIRNHPEYNQLVEQAQELGATSMNPEIMSLPHIY